MICEIREDGKEVVLHHPKLSDILAMLTLLFMPQKEIVFTKPAEEADNETVGERKDGDGNG